MKINRNDECWRNSGLKYKKCHMEFDEKLKSLTKLTLDGDYAQISWGLKIVDVEYEKPYVTLTYTNVEGELNKVFAECRDIENFNQQKVLEKALLKAFQNEIIKISVVKNSGIK